MTLRVATYNIHSCVGGDRLCNPDRTLAVLREIDADIFGLQEVGAQHGHHAVDQFHFLERHLEMAGVSGPNIRRGRNQFGNALFVRGEVLEATMIDLGVAPFETRGAIDCLARLRGQTVRIIVTHLGLFPHERRQQLRRLATALEGRSADLTIVLGDFNIFGPERRSLRLLGAPLRLPKLRSFPSRRPIMSLDRIWTLPNERLLDIATHRTALSKSASDHLPVVGNVDIAAHSSAAAA
jgi:endonuclease/exonuclease/phosphatase family metal-dependent hydrolase